MTQEIERQISSETELIKELEANPVLRENTKPGESAFYSPENAAYHQHVTKIRDAYWRRRNLQERLER